MGIDTKKILSTSLESYLKNKDLSRFDLVSIHDIRQYMAVYRSGDSLHGFKTHYEDDATDLNFIKYFADKVPENTEVVVDYNLKMAGAGGDNYNSYLIQQQGIALIPK